LSLRSLVLPYSPDSLPTDAQALRTAQEFAELVGRVINTTVSQCPVKFVSVEPGAFTGFVGYCPNQYPAPMRLQNDRFLYLYHRLGLRRDERFLTTLEYGYVYQESEDPDSWIFRYEYQREPATGYRYPKAHLHLNADPPGYPGTKPFPKLHIPTGRVTVEMIVRHLLDEHGLPCISPHWQDVLQQTEADFAEIQRRRLIAPE
jgi:hypothetical protein